MQNTQQNRRLGTKRRRSGNRRAGFCLPFTILCPLPSLKGSTMRRVLPLVVALFLVSCGGSSGPTAPQGPQYAQVAGIWLRVETLTAASGGGCLGPAFATLVGTQTRYTVSITQTGSAISGTSTSLDTGTSCSFTGSVGEHAITATTTACDVVAVSGIPCLSGALRDVELVASGSSGSVSGSVITGTSAETYNTFSSNTGVSTGAMTLNSSFTMTRQ